MNRSPDPHARRRGRGPSPATYAVGVALLTAVAAVGLLGGSGYGADERPSSAYTEPVQGLHGQTLAEYVAAHEVARLTR